MADEKDTEVREIIISEQISIDKEKKDKEGEFLEIFENAEFFESFNRKFNHLREKIIERKDISNLI